MWMNRWKTGNRSTLPGTLTQVDGEGAPLRGRGVEVAVFDVEIPRGHRLGAKAVEESHFGP